MVFSRLPDHCPHNVGHRDTDGRGDGRDDADGFEGEDNVLPEGGRLAHVLLSEIIPEEGQQPGERVWLVPTSYLQGMR